jgi:hypothetical protein
MPPDLPKSQNSQVLEIRADTGRWREVLLLEMAATRAAISLIGIWRITRRG